MQWLNHAHRFKGFVRDKEVQHDAGLDGVLVQGLYAPFKTLLTLDSKPLTLESKPHFRV